MRCVNLQGTLFAVETEILKNILYFCTVIN